MRQKTDKDERLFLTKSQLIKREGWSEACIKLFNLIHDKEATNHVFKSTSPIKLYLLEKIRQIETLDQFVEFKTKNLIRSNIRLKVAEAKRNELLTYINNLKIIVPNFEKDVLIKISCKHYNKHKQEIMFEQGEYFEYIPATNDSDMEFLSRICTNFLRHNMSNYEHELSKLFGKVGKNEAYHLLKFKINSAIFAKYDWIKFEEY